MGQGIGGGGGDGGRLCDDIPTRDRGERRDGGEYYCGSHCDALVVTKGG